MMSYGTFSEVDKAAAYSAEQRILLIELSGSRSDDTLAAQLPDKLQDVRKITLRSAIDKDETPISMAGMSSSIRFVGIQRRFSMKQSSVNTDEISHDDGAARRGAAVSIRPRNRDASSES